MIALIPLVLMIAEIEKGCSPEGRLRLQYQLESLKIESPEGHVKDSINGCIYHYNSNFWNILFKQ
jgi:hypothetical protein